MTPITHWRMSHTILVLFTLLVWVYRWTEYLP